MLYRDRGRRQRDDDGDDDTQKQSDNVKKEIKDDPEAMETDDPRWKKSMGGTIDRERLQRLANKDSDSEGRFTSFTYLIEHFRRIRRN